MFPVKDMRVVFIFILGADNFSRKNPSDDDMTGKLRTIDETSFYGRYESKKILFFCKRTLIYLTYGAFHAIIKCTKMSQNIFKRIGRRKRY
ncbi:MAG TPA: hypothetical protein DHU65_02215 [Clostridiales bacterium]|nr:hypothetical protein [Clostridiales bacterium]